MKVERGQKSQFSEKDIMQQPVTSELGLAYKLFFLLEQFSAQRIKVYEQKKFLIDFREKS